MTHLKRVFCVIFETLFTSNFVRLFFLTSTYFFAVPYICRSSWMIPPLGMDLFSGFVCINHALSPWPRRQPPCPVAGRVLELGLAFMFWGKQSYGVRS